MPPLLTVAWPALASALVLLPVPPACAQVATQPDFVHRWLAPDEPLRWRIDADQQAQWRRWRVFLGSSDVSALLRLAAPGELLLAPAGAAWTPGEGELVVYDSDGWAELARWPVRVRTAGGFETSEATPRLDLQLDGRGAEGRSDGAPASPRGTHADTGVSAGMAWRGTRGGWTLEGAANLSGSSGRAKALRFDDLGERAPKLDLADYRVSLSHGTHTLALGHQSAGTHPLLAQGYSSRGIGLTTRLGDHTDLALHVLHGTTVVGWDHWTGVDERDHQARLLTWGLELLPDRPGGLRAELSALDATRLSRTAFNTGSVPDAERSRGLGLRLLGASAEGVLSGELAWARARSDHPYDPALALAGELLPVRPATRHAVTGLLQWAVLRQAGAQTASGSGLDLTLNLRHDRTAPLYRSLADGLVPDLAATRLGLQAALAGASLQLQRATGVDNLARIASLLRTRTDETRLALNLPPAPWRGPVAGRDPGVWPSMAWTWQVVQQRAVNTPDPADSGFAASQRPDQVDRAQRVDLGWALPAGQLRYALARSSVDNRQPGRERADFRRLTHELAADAALGEAWRIAVMLSRGQELSVQTGLQRWRNGGSLQLDWQASERWALSAALSYEGVDDSLDVTRAVNDGVQLQLTRRVDWPVFGSAGGRTLPGQVYVRAAQQGQRQRDRSFGLDDRLRSWWLDVGLTVGFF